MVFPASHFYFIAHRIRIYPFDGKGVKRSSYDRRFFAIVFVGEAVIGGSTVRQLSRPCDLCSTVGSCLPHICLALDWVRACGLGFGGIVLPGRSEEHTSELQSPCNLVCRLLLEK